MTTRRPPSYGEFARFLENLPVAVYERRRGLGLSRWDAAPQIGISRQSLQRFEDGEGIEQIRIGILMPLLRWLDDSYKREDEGREHSPSDSVGPANDGSDESPAGPDRKPATGVPQRQDEPWSDGGESSQVDANRSPDGRSDRDPTGDSAAGVARADL